MESRDIRLTAATVGVESARYTRARQKPQCLYVQHSLPPYSTGHTGQPQFSVGMEYVRV